MVGQGAVSMPSAWREYTPGARKDSLRNMAQPLLLAMRKHVPADEYVNLVVEDDPRLSELLERAGARVRLEIVHMEGAL